jgi:hypothetical protein
MNDPIISWVLDRAANINPHGELQRWSIQGRS